jgi:hypothetical protein
VSHRHRSGHSIATLAGTITNHIQKITAGDANSSDTKTTATLDELARACNLQEERQRERERKELIVSITVWVVGVWR